MTFKSYILTTRLWVKLVLSVMQQFIQMILHYKILDSHQLKPFNIWVWCARPSQQQHSLSWPVTRLRDCVTVSLRARDTRDTAAGSGRAVTALSQPSRGREWSQLSRSLTGLRVAVEQDFSADAQASHFSVTHKPFVTLCCTCLSELLRDNVVTTECQWLGWGSQC